MAISRPPFEPRQSRDIRLTRERCGRSTGPPAESNSYPANIFVPATVAMTAIRRAAVAAEFSHRLELYRQFTSRQHENTAFPMVVR